jgi:dTDP-4-amino-4,6-dideoxygalactose transaminase
MYTSAADYVEACYALIRGKAAEGQNRAKLEAAIEQGQQVHAVCAPQGRVAIYAAIKSAVPAGKEVILSPNTIADVINMVICAGARPVFCDIDPATGNMDPERVEDLCTDNTAAIMVTHLYGLVAPMDRLKEIAASRGLLLIEDAAQAFGAVFNGEKAGTIGDIGIFSFGKAKNITGFAGGMLLTRHHDIAVNARTLLNGYSQPSTSQVARAVITCFIKDVASSDFLFPHLLFPIFRFGYHKGIKAITKHIETELDLSRKHTLPERYQLQLSDLQAGIARGHLSQVDRDYQYRMGLVQMYHDGLKDIEGLRLPPLLRDGSHVYNYYPIQCEDRLALRQYMLDSGRDIALQHIKNTADLPAFKDFYRDCPHCRKWAHETIMLPDYAKYRRAEVEKNIEVIRSYFNK